MDGQRTAKVYARERQVIEQFDQINEEAVSAYSRAEYAGTLVFSSVNFISNLSLALVSVFGALLYLNGSVSLKNISAFVQYSRRFSGPINRQPASWANCSPPSRRQSRCSVCWTPSLSRRMRQTPGRFAR